jgi:DNA-binding Lrp family transcriptional regulator
VQDYPAAGFRDTSGYYLCIFLETKKERGLNVCVHFLWNFRQYCFGVGCMPLAFVLVRTLPGYMEKILQEMRKIDGVKEAYMLYGDYDIVATIQAETTPKLEEKVFQIRKIDQVMSTLTLMAIT